MSVLYSDTEAARFRRIIEAAETVSGRHGRTIRPTTSLLTSSDLMRLIEHIQSDRDRPFRVMEFGPGSGYLGAQLIVAGFKYLAVENAQAFYLWQWLLFSELASDHGAPDANTAHIPWWTFVSLWREPRFNGSVDIIIADAVLAEMTPTARHYTMRLAMNLFTDNGLFVMGRPGQSIFSDADGIKQEFENFGFKTLRTGDLAVFALSDSPYVYPDRSNIQPIETGRNAANSILSTPSDDVNFWRFLDG